MYKCMFSIYALYMYKCMFSIYQYMYKCMFSIYEYMYKCMFSIYKYPGGTVRAITHVHAVLPRYYARITPRFYARNRLSMPKLAEICT